MHNNHESLSVVFGDQLKHPVKRWLILGLWGSVTLHLCANLFDDEVLDQFSRADPFGFIGRKIPRKVIETLEALPVEIEQ